MSRGKWISAGFSMAGAYFGIRFLILQEGLRINIADNLAAHIAFTIAVIGFVLGYTIIPEKYKGTAHLIAIIALIGLLLIGMSCCAASCREKKEARNEEIRAQIIDRVADKIAERIEGQVSQKLGLPQEKPCSNQGCGVRILPSGQEPGQGSGQRRGKIVQKKQSIYQGWGWKSANSTPIRNQ